MNTKQRIAELELLCDRQQKQINELLNLFDVEERAELIEDACDSSFGRVVFGTSAQKVRTLRLKESALPREQACGKQKKTKKTK